MILPQKPPQALRVCYCSNEAQGNAHTDAFVTNLHQTGMTIYTCRMSSSIATLPHLWHYLRLPMHDVIIVDSHNPLDVVVAWACSRLTAVPLVWHTSFSLHQTGTHLAYRLAEIILVYTQQNADYAVHSLGLNTEKIRVVSSPDTLRQCLHDIIPGFSPQDQMHWGAQPAFYGPRHQFREDYLFNALRRHAPGYTILDAACGAGTLLRRLAKQHYYTIGLDMSPDFLTYIRNASEASTITLLQGDIQHIPCTSEYVDGVIAGEVLEHLEDDATPVGEFWRILRPGGICVISVPAEPSQWDWHDNWAGHVRRYRRDELRRLLETQGFDVLRLHHYGFPFSYAFHRYIYLPIYRRKLRAYADKLHHLSTSGWWQQIAIYTLLLIFQFDNLFNRLPLGIGLIAIARKPKIHAHQPRNRASQHHP